MSNWVKLLNIMTSDYDDIINQLLHSYTEIGGINHLEGTNLPSRDRVHEFLDVLIELLFPGYFEAEELDLSTVKGVTTQKIIVLAEFLTKEVEKCFLSVDTDDSSLSGSEIVRSFLADLPTLRVSLKKDVHAIYKGDPAAKSESEIMLSYPGFYAITVYRLAHALYGYGVPLLPRIMTEISHSLTGIDIHPGASIGAHFCIDHGTGLVIGETAVIGDWVKLYQGVTIGALSLNNVDLTKQRHPTLEDHVTVYSGTTILGGDTVIGHHCIIGGNVWLVSSVKPHSKIYITADLKQISEIQSHSEDS